jgi:asparagine synthase (glutamine-hydrolysing)
MCGITGWANNKIDLTIYKDIIEKMTYTLRKRGPDDSGFYISQHALLGHRRLVVVDPKGGAQPMSRQHGGNSFTVVYNGELYNTEELRSLLLEKGYYFNSYSDTEVLLVSYIEWGTECVKKFNGIFAFGIWDENNRSLFLARDPLGVKPLFYTMKGDSILFGSELKALLENPMVEPLVDKEGLLEIFGLGPARSPGSGVFKGIKEIRPGHCLLYNMDGIKIREYWKLESAPHLEDLDTTIEHVRSLLIDAIERQLTADVPVCTFLSGGLDSSIISSIAAKAFREQNKETLNTYSIDYHFNDIYFKANEFQPNSDAHWAGKMAEYIGSNHHNIVLHTPELVEALIDAVEANDLPGMADIDSSLYLFCREIKKDATVALSGECADEIFGGYPWFRNKESINANTFPWSNAVKERRSILSKDFRDLPIEDYVAAKYNETINEVPQLDGESVYERRMREIFYLNIKWFMITLLNRKDRMSMSNSLEVRVPFADYRIVQYAFNIPASVKLLNGRDRKSVV